MCRSTFVSSLEILESVMAMSLVFPRLVEVVQKSSRTSLTTETMVTSHWMFANVV